MELKNNALKNKKCVVLGLGISNKALIEYLLSHGADIEARDENPLNENDDYFSYLKSNNIPVITGEKYLGNIQGDYIFRSPGIRPDKGDIQSAVANGSILSSETELFFDLCPCPVIAITGSDGKTTTTTLTAKLLEKTGRKVWLGGNIGIPLIKYVDEMTKDDIVVMELSSFQLMTFTESADLAAITNISPNHLNWHIDMQEYIDSKSNIFRHNGCNTLVLNANDGQSNYYRSLYKDGRVITFSAKCNADITLRDGYITEGDEKIIKTSQILIPGVHNIENYMAAIALTRQLGVTNEMIADLAESFGGVEHRLEFVREFEGVRYINSSIDSTPTRTAAALSALECKPVIICGGCDKHIPFDTLAGVLYEKAKYVILTGQTAQAIKSSILKNNCKIGYEIVDDFEKAIKRARDIAQPGDTVLLSPACASFDRFKNFEERGKAFKNTVNSF